MGKIDLQQFLLTASNTPASSATLSGDSVALLLTALQYTQALYNWLGAGGEFGLTQSEIDQIEAINDKAAKEIMATNVGQIVMGMWQETPAGYLPCDGATYNRADYPELYAKLHSVYRVDADTFIVPDLQSRFPLGWLPGDFALNQQFGERDHVIDVSEMPEHTHTAYPHKHTNEPHSHLDAGHNHVVSAASPAVVTIGAGAPTPSAVPVGTVTSTGFAAISTENVDMSEETINIEVAGESAAMAMWPPFTVVQFFVVAI